MIKPIILKTSLFWLAKSDKYGIFPTLYVYPAFTERLQNRLMEFLTDD